MFKKMNSLYMKFRLLIALIFMCLSAMLYAQDKALFELINCEKSFSVNDSLFKEATEICIFNKTDSVISLVFSFDKNGFWDEKTLTEKLLTGVSLLNDTTSIKLLILDNIASIIKTDNFRNYNLLFVSNEEEAVRKKYSPMLMLSCFFDMQCHNHQRLASQMALLTPYFLPEDFMWYYILRHTVLGVNIGGKYIFHDFDPGQPGYRFKSAIDDRTLLSLEELIADNRLIDANQFYEYNGKSLCPWITHNFYKTSFEQILMQSHYNDINKVYSFFPIWILPPQTQLNFNFPKRDGFFNFGVKVELDRNDKDVKNIFKTYERYITTQTKKDSIGTVNLFRKYLINKFNFNYEINYLYLLNKGLVIMGENTKPTPIMHEHYLEVNITTGNDTLFFLDDYFIPLPLHKVLVNKGHVFFQEETYQGDSSKQHKFFVADALIINLYNTLPPIFTPDSLRKPFIYNESPFVVGPINGYFAPFSEVRLFYYYNPFYYRFHDSDFQIKYLSSCKNEVIIETVKKEKPVE